MAGKLKRPYLKKCFPFGCGVRPNIYNRKGLQPLKKAKLEEAVKKIVGKSSRRMIVPSLRQSNYSIENSLAADDPARDKLLGHRHNECTAGRTLHTQHKKKCRMKNVAYLPRTSKIPTVANAKNPEDRNISSENSVMEYMEYAVSVTSHWDKEFVQKFSTRDYLLETQRQLQNIYCSKKMSASLKREQLLGTHVETSQVQPGHPLSAEHEQISWLRLLSDSPSIPFSPQIPLPSPILDPLQYLSKVFPKSENKAPCLLQKQNGLSEYFPAQYSEADVEQKMFDDIQQCGYVVNKSPSLEPYCTIPLLSPYTFNVDIFDPGAPNKIYKAASLYVPCKFSLSMDTSDVNFKYYPHIF